MRRRGLVACRIQLGPSKWLVVALGVVHVCAAFVILPIEAAGTWKMLACMALFGSALQTIRHDGLRSASCAVIRADLDASGRCTVTYRHGGEEVCEVLDCSFVSTTLIVLSLRPHGRRIAHHVVIAADAADDEALRRLRVWLRWGLQARRAT